MSSSQPPSTTEVFDRCWTLSIVVGVAIRMTPPAQRRAEIAAVPLEVRAAIEKEAVVQMSSLRDLLETNGALAHLTEREQGFLLTPPHKIPDAEWMLANARLEALATLGWALGFVPTLPPCDASPAVEILAALENAKGTPTLRPREEIDRIRDIAGLWHWRSQTQGFRAGVWPPPAGVGIRQLDEAIRDAAAGAVADGMITTMIDGDMPAMGKAYRDLTDAEWRQVSTTTTQRLHALNWICGYAPGNDWEATPLTI